MQTKKNHQLAVRCITVCLCLTSVVCPAQTLWYVDNQHGNDTNPGHGDWAAAFKTIGKAVAMAEDGDTVHVTGGTYNVTAQINITKAISLIGVDGPENTSVVGNYTKRGFFLSNEMAVVSGFTITNFKAHRIPEFDYDFGGGMVIKGGGTVSNCVFTGNSASRASAIAAGGVPHAATPYPGAYTIIDCVISNNIVSALSGAVAAHGTGAVINCVFDGNIATPNPNCAALLVNFANNSGIVSGCVFRANVTVSNASAVYAQNTLLTHCDIVDNQCPGLTLGGGATVSWCRVTGNTGTRGAGVLLTGGGTLRNCLIAGNTYSGAFGNALEFAGGTMESCTIVNNIAASSDVYGAIWFNNWSGHPERSIINTICYNNFDLDQKVNNWTGGNFDNSTVTYSCITPKLSGAVWGTGNMTNDPQLYSGYLLSPSSPCINTAAMLDWMAESTDVDGRQRLDRFSRMPDIGCSEYVPVGSMFRLR